MLLLVLVAAACDDAGAVIFYNMILVAVGMLGCWGCHLLQYDVSYGGCGQDLVPLRWLMSNEPSIPEIQ